MRRVTLYRLKDMIKTYIEDGDPEASLSVGTDMRKINWSFKLLKVVVTFWTYSVLLIIPLFTTGYS